MSQSLSLEQAEAKLYVAISQLVWIIPFLAIIELLLRYFSDTLSTWTASPFVSVLTILIYAIIILKIINIADKYIGEELKYRHRNK